VPLVILKETKRGKQLWEAGTFDLIFAGQGAGKKEAVRRSAGRL